MENQLDAFRREQPTPLAQRPLNLPTPSETMLSNGLRVVVVEQNRLPLVSYRLAFRTGDAFDPPALPGLLEVVTGMLLEGTRTRTSREIAEATARYGASLNAGAGSDHTTVAAAALSMYGDEVLELLADVALRPSFPDDELTLTKVNAQQNLIAQRAQPSFLASETLSRVIFGEHPYGVVSATNESLEAITRDELVRFHRSLFVPANAALFVAGDVRRDELLKRAEALFGDWRGGEAPAAEFPTPPESDGRALYLVDRPGSEQSNIVIANLAIKRTDPDYFPVLVMHTILGATASSRLFMNLREEKGYTYGAYTSLDARRFAGSFRATAEVRTPVTGASLTEFFGEFARIRDEDVSDKELRDAKSYLTGIFPIRLETQEGLVDQLVQMKMHGLPDDYLLTYRERIGDVTIADVRRVANEYITPERSAIVIVGDAAAIGEQVKPFAERIEIYDSSGKRREAEASNITTQS
ncbi:MAG: pitrilysin family protein [Pyrinomonadaceae bacterium]